MASNNASRVTKDTSARKNTRVGSIQSAVEAAATKESHDYCVNRLTEGYKQQLETMEQSYEDQIRELKNQFVASVEKANAEATRKANAKAAGEIQALEKSLSESKAAHANADKNCRELAKCAVDAEQQAMTDEVLHRAQRTEQREAFEGRIEKTQRENNSGPHRWIQVKLTRKFKTKMGEPRAVVKRGSTKVSELVLLAIPPGKLPDSWVFEHRGHQMSDMNTSLAQVSGTCNVK